MTFWTYLFVNTVLSLAVTAILIWTKPENRAKRAEAKMRREEDLYSMILEAAKRIDEERKPNPDFTPPPEKKPPAPQVNLCDNCCYRKQPCRKTGIRKCSNYIKAEPQKPPTTGTNVFEPKRRWDSWDEDDAEFEKTIRYAVEHECSYQAAKLALASVYNPAEESVKRYEARTAQLPHYCGNCIAHRQEKFDGEIIHVCMRHKVWLHNQERWDGGCDAWEPSPAICKLYKEWDDGFCSSCKYFEPEEPGQKRGMGLCARNDEIKMMGQSCAGYARKGELPNYLERQPMERPEPIGTITAH